MAKKKIAGTPGMGNAELYRAMQEKRRSSAASPHDTRPNRERSRRDAKRAAIRRDQE